MSKKITLQIVSGFLGAGKTTFIQAMLQELSRRNELRKQPEKIVYVVNEFGKSGIDKAIVADQPLFSYELNNGCICCTLKTEFSLLLQQIITEHQPDRIIFEPSGLFILSEMFAAFSGESYSDQLQIGAVVTIIDAWHDKAQSKAFSSVLQNQAKLSDLLVVSKLQAKPDSVISELVDLQLKYANIPILTRDAWDFTAEDWQQVLDFKARPLHQVRLNTTKRIVRQQLLWTQQHQILDAVTIPWTLVASRSEIEQRFLSFVDGQACEIIRAKGYICCEGRNWLIQIVRDQIDWHPADADEELRLTVIGNNLQLEKLTLLLSNNSPLL